ncbi:DnaA regulatory inactivator Hda [Legionella sp. D16C41]|uniref:DnaA regulatory inactivator Hda n=1 Tax=Legionella sp. D16C41 TaxID=3402688 RepID=UPI003AF6AA66
MNSQLALTIQLNHQATLSNFCWGNNLFLKQQIDHLLAGQGERFLYLWGDSGYGKSHLLQACCHAITQTSVYLPLDLLKEWGPASIEGMDEQRLIAIDDIDLIVGDKFWEEALFHLYNRVRENGNTILLIAGKKTPAYLGIQLPDLRSRLGWGLVIQIQELTDELKITALQQHAELRGINLSSSAALFLINRCTRNMHHLYKILDQLDEASLAAQRKITVPFIKAVLKI